MSWRVAPNGSEAPPPVRVAWEIIPVKEILHAAHTLALIQGVQHAGDVHDGHTLVPPDIELLSGIQIY